jgi:hypothetical protein
VNWQPLIEFLVSVGYGLLSSLVPVFNSEIYIVASQVGGFTEEVTTAVGCAVGQTIGKVGTVLALRGGGRSGLARRLRQRRERPRKPVGSRSDQAQGLVGPAAETPGWTLVGSSHCLPLGLSRHSTAVRGDPRCARDPDVDHPLRCGRPSRALRAVPRHSLRGLGIGPMSPRRPACSRAGYRIGMR